MPLIPVSALIFGAATLVLTLGGATEIVRAVELRDVLRGALGGLLIMLALALGYETFALDERKPLLWPTISHQAATAFANYPGLWLVILLALALLFGALLYHFTSQGSVFGPHTGWVMVATALGALLAGALIARLTHWLALPPTLP